jgi:hypothetical protein
LDQLSKDFESMGAAERKALAQALSTDPLNKRSRRTRRPAPLNANSTLLTGYTVDTEKFAQAVVSILTFAYEVSGTYVGRNAPLRLHANLAQKVILLAKALDRAGDHRRTVARRALALEYLIAFFEKARDRWPTSPGRKRLPSAPRVPAILSAGEEGALAEQLIDLQAWVRRVGRLGLTLPKNVDRMLPRLRASRDYVLSNYGPVKVAAKALEKLIGVSARQLQKDRDLPTIEASRLVSSRVQSKDALAAFANDLLAGRDPLVASAARRKVT